MDYDVVFDKKIVFAMYQFDFYLVSELDDGLIDV